jgi:ABC-2 type transport system permease protein
MTGWEAAALVARREIEQRVRGRVFLLGTLAIVILVFAAALIPSLRAEEDGALTIGLVGSTPATLVEGLHTGAEGLGATVETRPYRTIASGELALRDGDVGVLVVDGRRLVWKSQPEDRLREVAGGAIQRARWLPRAAGFGLTAEQANALLAAEPVPERQLEPSDPDDEARYAAALLGALLLGLTLSLYGQAVANGVAQEKGTRVMEVLLSRVAPRDLLAGKVIGIGLVGLAQLLVGALASLAAVLTVDRLQLPSAVPSVLGWVVLWFTLGYGFFSVIYAALGALVSRPEDVEGAQAPLGFLLMGCLLLAVYATDSPDAFLVRLASFVPITAPFVMPVRAAVSDVPIWEVAISGAIMVASTYAVVRVAARVYAGAVLRTGPRLRWSDVWQAVRTAHETPAGP